MNYTIRVSDRTLTSAVHDPRCGVVTKRQAVGYHCHPVEAPSPQAAATGWDTDNDTEARKLPKTKICRCCGAPE